MSDRKPDSVLLTAIAVLLLLRFVPAILFCYFAFPRPILQVGPMGSFLVFLFLIHHERRRISTFNIDQFSIFLILLCFPVQFVLPLVLGFEGAMSQLNVALSVLTFLSTVVFAGFFLLHFKEYSFRPTTIATWVFPVLGPVAGILIAVVWAFPMSFQVTPRTELSGVSLLFSADTINHTLQLLGSAAVFEEPFFRAFLWGFLALVGFKNRQILILQTLLFAVAHFYYVPNSLVSFFFIVPFGALCLGYLAMKTKSIASSIVAHGVSDGLGYTLGYIVAEMRR